MERAMGIEPTTYSLEAVVLPLNYAATGYTIAMSRAEGQVRSRGVHALRTPFAGCGARVTGGAA